MEGFFSKKEIESKSRPGGKKYSCVTCGLYKNCKSPRMAPYGNFKKKILNIGEAPGEVEDRRGKPFQGKTGRLLQEAYASLGIDLFEDCLNINAVNCRPMTKSGKNRAPTNAEIDCCRKSVLNTIAEYKPKVIVLLGSAAVYSIIGHRWKKDLGGITKWRGWTIPDQDFKAWVCPTFHPSYVQRSFFISSRGTKQKSVEETIWIKDLENAIGKVNEPFLKYIEPDIDFIDDLEPLNNIKSDFAFDYETTGLKPHADGHRIICAAVADSENHAFVFLIPKKRKERRPLIDLLENEEIGKFAHNMKFEDQWTHIRLHTTVNNWLWDSMVAAHILDNRSGTTSLKFQAYVQFGIVDYASEITPYLQAVDPTSANSINTIMKLVDNREGRKKLLRYCGYDAVYEYRLAQLQRELVRNEGTLPF